jgi:fatty acid desaturase
MHDTMHNHIFHSRKIDQGLGWLFGNVLLGISRKWWRDEHHEHHLFVNSLIEGENATDPQMKEDVWVQDMRVASFSFSKMSPLLQRFVARFQHLYVLPVLVLAGPYAIKNASFQRETQPFEIAGLVLYFVWVGSLLSMLPTWQEAFIFYATSMVCLGVLSIQLVISHYTKPWTDKHTRRGWARYQIESVLDIWCSPYFDWFYGGLHIHSVHHLFPRMGRCYYRQVHPEIVQLCVDHDVELEIVSFYEGVVACINHFKDIGKQLQVQLNEQSNITAAAARKQVD